MRWVLLLAALLTVPEAADAQTVVPPLPQGIRARVWSHSAGVIDGTLTGQLETALVIHQNSSQRCRELVAETVASAFAGGTVVMGSSRTYVPAECPGVVVIPGADVTRVDVSDGISGNGSGTGALIGLVIGFGAGYYAVASDGGSTGDTIVYGTAIGVPLGFLAGWLGQAIGAGFDTEVWRQIR